MDENHQNVAGNKPITDDNKLWTPPLSAKDRKKLDHLRKKPFAQRMGFAGKTPWDFIQLLLFPLVLLIIGSLLSYQQNQTSLRAAADQQRETTLKTGLDDIKDLLLNKGLRASKPDDSVRVVARAEVLSTLRQLDGGRKETLMRFLSEAGLITRSRNGVIIDLAGADLAGANLTHAHLGGANLSGADLSYANLSHADLSVAHLSDALVTQAQLNEAK